MLNSAHTGSGLRGMYMLCGLKLKSPSPSPPCQGGPLSSMQRSQLALKVEAMCSRNSDKGLLMNQ